MKTLTLIRHAKSSWDEPGKLDFERPLNRRGQRDAPKMGQRLAGRGFAPDLLVSSPALRALTTAQIIADRIDYPQANIVRERDLYLASLGKLLDITASQDDTVDHLVLFGHNPGFTAYANYLVPGVTDNVPTCGVVSMRIATDTWAIYDRPQATLDFFDYPKKLGAN